MTPTVAARGILTLAALRMQDPAIREASDEYLHALREHCENTAEVVGALMVDAISTALACTIPSERGQMKSILQQITDQLFEAFDKSARPEVLH